MELGINKDKIDEIFTDLGIAHGDLVTTDQLHEVIEVVIAANNEAIKNQLQGFFEEYMSKFVNELALEARRIR